VRDDLEDGPLARTRGPEQELLRDALERRLEAGRSPDDDMEQRRRDIVAAVANVDSGSGVIVLTDMFGGLPQASKDALYEHLGHLRVHLAHGQSATEPLAQQPNPSSRETAS